MWLGPKQQESSLYYKCFHLAQAVVSILEVHLETRLYKRDSHTRYKYPIIHHLLLEKTASIAMI